MPYPDDFRGFPAELPEPDAACMERINDAHVFYTRMLDQYVSLCDELGFRPPLETIESVMDLIAEALNDELTFEVKLLEREGHDLNAWPANHGQMCAVAYDTLMLVNKLRDKRPQAGWRENAKPEEVGQP